MLYQTAILYCVHNIEYKSQYRLHVLVFFATPPKTNTEEVTALF